MANPIRLGVETFRPAGNLPVGTVIDDSFYPEGFLAGKYQNAFNLDYTTASPATGPSGSLGASPEQSGFSGIGGLDPNKEAELAQQKYFFDTLLNIKDKENSPEAMRQKFEMLDALQASQAARMMRYGTQSNVIGALLKDLPKAIAGPAWEKARYADLEAQGPLFASQAIRPAFSNRDYINL
jgi:hypothetical protein